MHPNNVKLIERLIKESQKFTYEYVYECENSKSTSSSLSKKNISLFIIRSFELSEWEKQAYQILSNIKADENTLNLFGRGKRLIYDAEDKQAYKKGFDMILESLKSAIKYDTTNDFRVDLNPDPTMQIIKELQDHMSRELFDIENNIKERSFKQDYEELKKRNDRKSQRELEFSGFMSIDDYNFFDIKIFKEYEDCTGRKMIVISNDDYNKFIEEVLLGCEEYSDNEWKKLINRYKAKSIPLENLVKKNINPYEYWRVLNYITENLIVELKNKFNVIDKHITPQEKGIIDKYIIKLIIISGIDAENENHLANAVVDQKIKSLDELQYYIKAIELLKQLKNNERKNLFDNTYETLKSFLKQYPKDKKSLWLDVDVFKSDELHFFKMQLRIWWIAKIIMESDLGNTLIIPAEIFYAAAKWYQEYGDFKNAIHYYNKILLSENNNKTKLKVLKEAIYLYTGPLKDLEKFEILVEYFEIQKNAPLLIQSAIASYDRLRNFEKSMMILETIRNHKDSYPLTEVKAMYLSYIDLLNKEVAETNIKDEKIIDLKSNKIRIAKEFEELKQINILREEDEYSIERNGNVINEKKSLTKL